MDHFRYQLSGVGVVAPLVATLLFACGSADAPTSVSTPVDPAPPTEPETPSSPCVAHADLDAVCGWWVEQIEADGEVLPDHECTPVALGEFDGPVTRVAQLRLGSSEEHVWWSLLAVRARGRWFVMQDERVFVTPAAEDSGLTLAARAEASGVLVERTSDSENGGGGSYRVQVWLLTFAHGAPRVRFEATTQRSFSISSNYEEEEGYDWSLPIEWVGADQIVTGPSALEERPEESESDDMPEAQPRREVQLPDCGAAPDTCELACVTPEEGS